MKTSTKYILMGILTIILFAVSYTVISMLNDDMDVVDSKEITSSELSNIE